MRYLGHLDMMRYFQKAVLRSGIPARYTEGFHPHQIMSFAYPLGVSMETEGDYMDLELTEAVDPEALVSRLNMVMNEEIYVSSAVMLPEKAANAMASVAAADYRLTITWKEKHNPDETCSEGALHSLLKYAAHKLMECEEIPIGEKAKDIRPGIYSLEADGDELLMLLSSGSKLNVRPADVWTSMQQRVAELTEAELVKITRTEIYGCRSESEMVPLDRLYEADIVAEQE